jgi:hypothetical protein
VRLGEIQERRSQGAGFEEMVQSTLGNCSLATHKYPFYPVTQCSPSKETGKIMCRTRGDHLPVAMGRR